MHLPPSTKSTYAMMMGECMHVSLFIKKVMSMHNVSIHPIVIIIKKIWMSLMYGGGNDDGIIGTELGRFNMMLLSAALCFIV